MSKSEISDRWGKIVQRCHPSVGESTYLAIWNAVFKICAYNCFQKSVYVSKRHFDFSKLSSQIILLWSYFHICLKKHAVPFTSTNLSFHLTSIPSMSCSNVFKTTIQFQISCFQKIKLIEMLNNIVHPDTVPVIVQYKIWKNKCVKLLN